MKLLRENFLNFQLWPAGVRWTVTAVVWLGLTVCFYQPAGQVLDGGLDASIFTAYAYFLAHGFQFGPEGLGHGWPLRIHHVRGILRRGSLLVASRRGTFAAARKFSPALAFVVLPEAIATILGSVGYGSRFS